MDIFMELVFISGCVIQAVWAQSELAALLSGNGLFGVGVGVGGGGVLSSCPHQPHSNPLKYTQIVNDRQVTMDCAPGTMFDGTACSCVNLPKANSQPQAGSNPRLAVAQSHQPGTNPRLETAMSILAGRQARTSDPTINSLIQQLQAQGVPPAAANMLIPSTAMVRQQVSRQPSRVGQIQRIARAKVQEAQAATRMSVPQQTRGQQGRTRSQAARTPTARANPNRAPSRAVPTRGLPAGLPPVVMQMLQRSQNPPPTAPSSRVGHSPVPTMRPKRLQTRLPKATAQRRQSTRTPTVPTQRQPTNIPPTLASPRRQLPSPGQAIRRGSPGSDPMASLLAQLALQQQSSSSSKSSQDPMKGLLGGLMPSMSQSPAGLGGSRGIAAMLAGLGGAGAVSPLGGAGGGDMSALLAGMVGQGASASSPGSAAAMLSPGGALDVTSLAGNHRVASLLGETPGPDLVRGMDLTQLFNLQGQMGAGGGIAGLRNINTAALEQLDRQGIIDIGDLTPAGLAAANAHFQARG